MTLFAMAITDDVTCVRYNKRRLFLWKDNYSCYGLDWQRPAYMHTRAKSTTIATDAEPTKHLTVHAPMTIARRTYACT